METGLLRPARAAALAAAALLSGAALADDAATQLLQSTWTLRVAVVRANVDTVLRADGPNGTGTSIDLGDTFGVSQSQTEPAFTGGWRFAQRHQILVDYFSLRRKGTRVINSDIAWGGEVFPASDTLTATFKDEVIAVSYAYSFLHEANYELAASIGVHFDRFVAKLDSQALGQVARSVAEGADLPLPVIGLQGAYAFDGNWAVFGKYQWFGLEYNGISGRLDVGRIGLGYYPFRNVGFELGYAYTREDLGLSKRSWTGEIQHEYKGPYLGMNLAF